MKLSKAQGRLMLAIVDASQGEVNQPWLFGILRHAEYEVIQEKKTESSSSQSKGSRIDPHLPRLWRARGKHRPHGLSVSAESLLTLSAAQSPFRFSLPVKRCLSHLRASVRGSASHSERFTRGIFPRGKKERVATWQTQRRQTRRLRKWRKRGRFSKSR
jgi:hypothetical protein